MRELPFAAVLICFLAVLFSGCIVPPSTCGNGICEQGENQLNCLQDCPIIEHHKECSGQTCITVEGAGKDQCSTDSDCESPPQTHKECSGTQCATVQGAGTDQCSADVDCGGLQSCDELGGQVLFGDSENEGTDEEWFYKWKTSVFHSCNGQVVDSADGNCCVGGETAALEVWAYSPSEIKVIDPMVVQFSVISSKPAVEVEYANGTKRAFDCNQGDSKSENCWLRLEPQNFSTTGTKTTRLTIQSGQFAGESIAISAEALTEADFSSLCSQRQGQFVEAAMLQPGLDSAKKFFSSGKLYSVQEGEKAYLIDPAIASQYLKINPNASLEELHQATIENNYIVELKQQPALQTYYNNFSAQIEETLKRYGVDSPVFKQLKGQADSVVASYADDVERGQEAVIAAATRLGGQVNARFKYSFNGFAIELPAENAASALSALKGNPAVKSVYPNMPVEATLDESVPLINADDVWSAFSARGEGISIGIIDTGVDYTHPDLGGCLGAGCKVKGGYDFVNSDSDPMDDHGHGTHVAGIAASDGALKGVAPRASIYAIKVLDSGGHGSWGDVIAGIEWAIDPNGDGSIADHLDVINLSLGGGGNPDDPVSQAIDRASDAGIVPVVAAGNSGGYLSIGSPGTARKALTVGAALDASAIADFSSKGPVLLGREIIVKPEVSAPGVQICSSQFDSAWADRQCFDGKHVAINGTSMATPHIAGVAALLKQVHPDWTSAQIKGAIISNASEMPGVPALAQGSGLVDAMASAEAVVLPNPAAASLGFFDDKNQAVIELQNVSGIPQGVSIGAAPVFKRIDLEGIDDDEVDLSMSLSSDCIQPGESATLSVSIAETTVPAGFYSSNIKLGIRPDCGGVDTGEISIPVSFAHAKFLFVDIGRNPMPSDDENEITYDLLVRVYDSNGNGVGGTSYWGIIEDAPKLPVQALVFSNEDDFVLYYYSSYDANLFSPKRFFSGAKDLNLPSRQNFFSVDEHSVEQMANNMPSYFASNGLQANNFKLISQTEINGKKAGMEYTHSYNSACNMWSTRHTVFRPLALDRQNSYYMAFNGVPNGYSIFNAQAHYIAEDKAEYPGSDKSFDVDAASIKSTTITIHNSITSANEILMGFAPYHESAEIIFSFINPIVPGGSKQLNYTSNPEFGVWTPANYNFNETNPILSQKNWVPYVTYNMHLFNGKTTEEFSSDWSDIPTGDIAGPVEFMKEPVAFGNLSFAGNYLYHILRNSYRNSQWFESLWSLYTPEEVASKRKGLITVTTPSGSTITGSGVQFFIDCYAGLEYSWPKIYPCEPGIYHITINTDGLFRDGNYSAAYDANWTGSYWELGPLP